MQNACYDTDLTEARWREIQPHLPGPARLGRPPTDPRLLLDAMLYVVRSGVQWRLLPKSFPPWQTVYHVFRRWCGEGLWRGLNDRLRAMVRTASGHDCRPSAGIHGQPEREVRRPTAARSATTRARRSRAASAISSWTPSGWSPP